MDLNWADITTAVASGVTAVGVLIAWVQIREARLARMGETLVTWTDAWNSLRTEQMAFAKFDGSGFAELVRSVYSGNKGRRRLATLLEVERVANWFENIAILQREHAVPLSFVERCWGDMAIQAWEQWMPAAVELRNYHGPATYREWEDLVGRIKRRRAFFSAVPAAGELD